MAEAYASSLRGVGLQLMARLKPLRPSQREDIKINGSRLTLLDINNRVKDETGVSEAFPWRTSNADIYSSQLQPFIPTALQGMNVGIFAFGASGAGKTHSIEGSNSENGIATLFVDGLFSAISRKQASEKNYFCTVRVQFVEIIDEEITDLLGGRSEELETTLDEWEGPTVENSVRKAITNEQQFLELFKRGISVRSSIANEFGKLSNKACSVLTIEIVQTTDLGEDTQVLVSKVFFVDLPGCEVLVQDPETLRIKQGSTLNQGILAIQSIINDLSSGRKDFAVYGTSHVTKLTAELWGGNAIGIGLFNLQYDDPVGSSMTFKVMKQCQKVINFPIVNDNRAICLMRKQRLELARCRAGLEAGPAESMAQYQQQLEEMEKQALENNIGVMNFDDDKKMVGGRIKDLRAKYNSLVESKTELQKELLQSEQEKVNLAKGLIEFQIANARLQEQLQNSRYDDQAKGLGEEADNMELNLKHEHDQQMIAELQEELKRMDEENQEMKLELMALKKNYLTTRDEFEQQKRQNDSLKVEIL